MNWFKIQCPIGGWSNGFKSLMHNLPIKKNVPTEMIILTSLVALFIFEQITNKLGQMRAFDPREKGHYKTSSDLKLDKLL